VFRSLLRFRSARDPSELRRHLRREIHDARYAGPVRDLSSGRLWPGYLPRTIARYVMPCRVVTSATSKPAVP
jgi:hypothetical protein